MCRTQATERLESAQRAAADADAELRAELARVDAQRRAERAELEEVFHSFPNNKTASCWCFSAKRESKASTRRTLSLFEVSLVAQKCRQKARREDVARLTATMEQREETARTFHVDEARLAGAKRSISVSLVSEKNNPSKVAALNAERERRLEALHSEQTLHNQTMLDAFEADRKRKRAPAAKKMIPSFFFKVKFFFFNVLE